MPSSARTNKKMTIDRALRASAELIQQVGQMMCAPFWWSLGDPGSRATEIMNNGTICYVDTGTREMGITAHHVYRTYLRDRYKHADSAVECQFGSNRIDPERQVIATSDRWDIATFDAPAVFVNASAKRPKDHHHAVRWPPTRTRAGEPVLYGGYPSALSADKGVEAEFPFQWIMGRVLETDDDHIYVRPEFHSMNWMGPERNYNPSGWSGGPVFRESHDSVIIRLELVGFIYAFVSEEDVVARHADVVLPDGGLR
jgi:hypothetical protein